MSELCCPYQAPGLDPLFLRFMSGPLLPPPSLPSAPLLSSLRPVAFYAFLKRPVHDPRSKSTGKPVLARCVIIRHLHLQSLTRVSEILCHESRRFLSNCKGHCEGIRSHVVWCDGKVCYFEALDTVDVEAFIEDAMLHDAVPLPGSHGARAQAVPGGLHVALDPFFDGLDVLFGILELPSLVLAVAGDDAFDVLRCELVFGLWERDAPAAVLDTGSDVARKRVSVCVWSSGVSFLPGMVQGFGLTGQVEVMSASFRVVVKDGMHTLALACVGIHTSGGLARLNVAPDHRYYSMAVMLAYPSSDGAGDSDLPISRGSFMNPASKSGTAYGSGDVM